MNKQNQAKLQMRVTHPISKATANFRAIQGETPLFAACHNNNAEVLRMLLEDNADKDQAVKTGGAEAQAAQRAFSSLPHQGLRPTGPLALSRLAVNAKMKARRGHLNLSRTAPPAPRGVLLLRREAALVYWMDWLHNSTHNSETYTFELRHVARELLPQIPGCRNSQCEETPLHVACHRNSLECARLLLDLGADKNRAALNGATPLLLH